MKRRILCLAALLLTALTLLLLPPLSLSLPHETLPGAPQPERRLLRVWLVSAPGGGAVWLRRQLAAFEADHPGIMTHLRQVTASECLREDTVLPDVLFYMPGDFTAPETLFEPLTTAVAADDALLRCGRWQTLQYGLPLCCGGYVLAIDSAFDELAAQTPAPTTLLGRPAPTSPAAASPTPGLPIARLMTAPIPLLAPQGAGLFVPTQLQLALPLPEGADLSSSEVYQQFLQRKCASAVLTTGQYTALCEMISVGRAFPVRVAAPQTMVTDQVLLGSIVKDAPSADAGALLGYLLSEEAQAALRDQALYGVRADQPMYTTGLCADMEAAARRGLYAPNAYLAPSAVHQAAWQAFTGALTMEAALAPLL